MEELKLVMNKDGVFEQYKEPYATIEVPTEEDFRWLEDAAREKTEREKGCEYCTGFKTFPTFCDGKANISKLIPLPAVDLMTGKMEGTADPPFFAIRILSDENGEDFVPIRFCPKCGRDLGEE